MMGRMTTAQVQVITKVISRHKKIRRWGSELVSEGNGLQEKILFLKQALVLRDDLEWIPPMIQQLLAKECWESDIDSKLKNIL